MHITKSDVGETEFTMTLNEFVTIKDCLNEVCNGFYVLDFESQIGAPESTVRTILRQFVAPLRPYSDG